MLGSCEQEAKQESKPYRGATETMADPARTRVQYLANGIFITASSDRLADDANDKKRNHGIMSSDKSRVDNEQRSKLRKRVDQPCMMMEED